MAVSSRPASRSHSKRHLKETLFCISRRTRDCDQCTQSEMRGSLWIICLWLFPATRGFIAGRGSVLEEGVEAAFEFFHFRGLRGGEVLRFAHVVGEIVE